MLATLPRRSLGRDISRQWPLLRTSCPNAHLLDQARPWRRAIVPYTTRRCISTSSLLRREDGSPASDSDTLPPQGQPADDPSWKLRIEQKTEFIAPALEAARRGTPPPWPAAKHAQEHIAPITQRTDPQAFTSAPDPSLFAFVRTRLLRIAQAELEEDSWVVGEVDTVPAASRMASSCFTNAIENYLGRGDYWCATVLLEDWLRFLPLVKFSSKAKDEEKRVTASALCWRCLQAFDVRARGEDEATCQAWASRVKELHYASDEARVPWSSEIIKRTSLLLVRTGHAYLCSDLLRRHLQFNLWPSKRALTSSKGTGKSTQSSEVAVAMTLVARVGTFLGQQSQALVQEAVAGHDDGGREDHIARVRSHFASLVRLAKLFSRGQLPQFRDPSEPDAHMTDPYTGCVREMCKARELWQTLPASSSSSAYDDNFTSEIDAAVEEVERRAERLIRTVFTEDQIDMGPPSSLRARRLRTLQKARPVPSICNILLRFSLRNLDSPDLAAHIINYMIGLAKESAARGHKVEEGEELASDAIRDPDDNEGRDAPQMTAHSAEATHLGLRAAHTTLLNEAVRLREPEMELAALQIIMCEEMGSGWLREQQSRSLRGRDASEFLSFAITAQDHAYLLQSSLSERDFSRTCSLLRFLTVNALVLGKTEMHSIQASMESGRRVDPLIRSHSNLTRFGTLRVGPIEAMSILRIFFPSMHARIKTQRKGAISMHHAYTDKEIAILQDPGLCVHILNALVKGSCWDGIEAVWTGIYNTATARSGGDKRTVSVQEATVLMQYFKIMTNETMRVLRRDAGRRDERSVGAVMQEILSCRSRVRDEYRKVKEHWKVETGTRAGVVAGIHLDARFFNSVLSALAWPDVMRASKIGEAASIQEAITTSAPTETEDEQQSYFKPNVRGPSAQQSEPQNLYTRACLSLLEDGDSAEFLLEVLSDMQVRDVPIPAAYTQDLLPYLGLAESTVDARLVEDMEVLRKKVAGMTRKVKQRAKRLSAGAEDEGEEVIADGGEAADNDLSAEEMEALRVRVATQDSRRYHISLRKDRGLHRSPVRQRILDGAKGEREPQKDK